MGKHLGVIDRCSHFQSFLEPDGELVHSTVIGLNPFRTDRNADKTIFSWPEASLAQIFCCASHSLPVYAMLVKKMNAKSSVELDMDPDFRTF